MKVILHKFNHNLEYPELKEQYLEEIARPMDISTLEKNLKQGEYTSIKAFVDDVNLIWKNCQQFNEKKSEIYVQSSRLRGTITKTLNEMGITQSVEGDKKNNNRKRDKSDSSVISTLSNKSFLSKKRKHSESKNNKTERDNFQNNKSENIKRPQKEIERGGRELKKGEEKKEGKREESKERAKKIVKNEPKRLRIVDDEETGGEEDKTETPKLVDKKIIHSQKALNLRKEDEKGKSNVIKKKEYKPLCKNDTHHIPINKQKINKKEDIKQHINKNDIKKTEESKDIRSFMNSLSEKRKETSNNPSLKKGGESGGDVPKEKTKVHESIMSRETSITNTNNILASEKENEKVKDNSKKKDKNQENETQSKTTPSCSSEQKTNSGSCNQINEKAQKCEKDNSSISSSKNSKDKESQEFPYVTDQDKFELVKISDSLSDDDLVQFLVFVNSLDPKTIEGLPGDALAVHFEKIEKDNFEKVSKYAKTLANKEAKPNNQPPVQINNENNYDQAKVEIVPSS